MQYLCILVTDTESLKYLNFRKHKNQTKIPCSSKDMERVPFTSLGCGALQDKH